MKYDLSNQLHRQQIRDKVKALLSKHNGIVEIKEIKPQRTMKQNSYLHLIINFFAAEYGENAEFVNVYNGEEVSTLSLEDKHFCNRACLKDFIEAYV